MSTSSPKAALLESIMQANQERPFVEMFSEAHDDGLLDHTAKKFQHLLPATSLHPNEQYAFEVNLDACSGCKACVVGCHHKNGLGENETWRSVGVISHEEQGHLQVVTTACHHCREPGCMQGCPVGAYTKDLTTGVVRHLDDQCIGCKYCTWTCPYEVPKFQEDKGIVRKCDMCISRLEVGEAPACVQSCPNEAIRITKVSQEVSVVELEQGWKVSDSPSPLLTSPTTVYKSQRDISSYTRLNVEALKAKSHEWSLVVLLITTQSSVGLLFWSVMTNQLGMARLGISLALASIGLLLAPLHLGQPQKAWKVIVGLKNSWLSREAVVLGGYHALLGMAWTISLLMKYNVPVFIKNVLTTNILMGASSVALCMGLFGVFASAKVYTSTAKWVWRFGLTIPRFTLSGLLMGMSIHVAIHGGILEMLVMLVLLMTKACIELYPSQIGKYKNQPDYLAQKTLLKSILKKEYILRWIFLSMASALLVVLMVLHMALNGEYSLTIPLNFAKGISILTMLCIVAGEITERSLFFASAAMQGMPIAKGVVK